MRSATVAAPSQRRRVRLHFSLLDVTSSVSVVESMWAGSHIRCSGFVGNLARESSW